MTNLLMLFAGSLFGVLVAGLISGVILDPPFLLFVGLAMIVIAFYLHRPTLQRALTT